MNIKYITLTKGYVAAVDAEDYERINQRSWYVVKSGNTYRAYSDFPVKIAMHTFIMNTPDGLEVDHKDGVGLNNCKFNLRVCTHSQNLQNQRKQSFTSSMYKGVSWNKGISKWESYIKKKGIRYNLGYYKEEKEAALNYNLMAKLLFGEFAKLNSI